MARRGASEPPCVAASGGWTHRRDNREREVISPAIKTVSCSVPGGGDDCLSGINTPASGNAFGAQSGHSHRARYIALCGRERHVDEMRERREYRPDAARELN